MGSWGQGPFDNDQALDIIGELAELEEGERRERLRRLFTTVLDPSSAPAEAEIPFWPKEVIAAASLIALAVPGGQVVFDPESTADYDPQDELNSEDEWSDALVPDPGAELVRLASEALQVVADPNSRWFIDWVGGDAAEAAWLANIFRVLNDGGDHP